MSRIYYVFLSCFFIMCLSFISVSAQTNYKIRGTVMDESKQPLTGVLVIPNSGKPVYTNNDGAFILDAAKGDLVITLRYLGNEDLVINQVVKNENIDLGKIAMTEKATFLKEVNVSATAMPYKSSFEGSNHYVSPLQLKKIQPISTEEVLKTLPGVNVLGDMGLSNRLNVSIRGSWGRRSEKVLMMEDGSPISPAPYTAPGIYYNPISDRIDGIEVYTGADILRYGPNNMFGIINYITPKPPQQPGLRAKISGGQRGYFTGLLSYGGTWNKVGSQIEAVYKRFDGFTKNSSVDMINLNAKIFAELAENQSIYFKISGQFEDNKASLSSITPYTFSIDPTEGPFDADRFTMHRYGLDIIHKWVPNSTSDLTTKIFASDFARDWWRQSNTVVKAANVRGYVGEEIFSQRYSYLDGKTFGDDDYVRVGTITNGRESTTDSRWHFTVAAIEETYSKKWSGENWSNGLEAQFKLYTETYKDQVLAADSTRWARSGRFTTDLAYDLQSVSGYIRNHFVINKFEITPILRVEKVWMNREDRLALARNPNLTSDKDLARVNEYSIFQPGLTLGYQFSNLKVFGSAYKGYIAPSKYFAFLVERDGVLVNPLSAEDLSNVKPEVSLNTELGIRGEIIKGRLAGQIAVFNNRISNFYVAGWNEYFDKLAVLNVGGFEAALRYEILPLGGNHKLSIQPNITLLRTNVASGELVDRHLFTQIKHTAATKQEFVDKVNSNPSGYDVFVKQNGVDVKLDRAITIEDLDNVSKTVYKFGENGIKDGVTPYAPEIAYNVNLYYTYKKFGIGFGYNFVGDQYGEFANFENESGDGGLGKIKSFHTFDANVNYDFMIKDIRASLFVAAKNLGDEVFVASRLNRGQSGIMSGGFRQINAGLNFVF
ncbi:MAG TPA: TonB-dependent receptor plug domain-containing protein [Saprospiraceae bacterium]|nr:TonB-dependent receptor plug domain-containing protein [Saprospiraceae bacterium]